MTQTIEFYSTKDAYGCFSNFAACPMVGGLALIPNDGMTDKGVAELVRRQVGDHWTRSNLHGVDLARCLVSPRRISVIDRRAKDGRVSDEVIRVWLVLEERTDERDGYKIVFDEKSHCFGLASPGFTSDAHAVLCGWYGDFWTTFDGM